ncbi:MAG: hypothetical protein PF588_01910 [Candidatus Kapabacteria bacterium]|jgi:tellurite resistance protein|nr:hypothetical protein [Candidatus Kapabacteria bacterium]
MKHFNAAWFIPAVGNILVPIAGVDHGYTQVSWFFYSIGIILWIVLFTIFWNRIIFHKPLPQKLMPTMFTKIKFFLSWWAYSFPISAITIATLLMYHSTELVFFKIFSYVLLSILVLMIPVLIALTVKKIKEKEICVEED